MVEETVFFFSNSIIYWASTFGIFSVVFPSQASPWERHWYSNYIQERLRDQRQNPYSWPHSNQVGELGFKSWFLRYKSLFPFLPRSSLLPCPPRYDPRVPQRGLMLETTRLMGLGRRGYKCGHTPGRRTDKCCCDWWAKNLPKDPTKWIHNMSVLCWQ